MARKRVKDTPGRPPKPINWEQFEQLCALHCTREEIGSFFHLNPDQITFRVKQYYHEDYMVIYKRFSEQGKCSLRRNQFKMTNRNATMAIFLGKQWLGQKDDESTGEMDARAVLSIYQELQDLKSKLQARGIDLSTLEDEQPLLHQRPAGEKDQVPAELGADTAP